MTLAFGILCMWYWTRCSTSWSAQYAVCVLYMQSKLGESWPKRSGTFICKMNQSSFGFAFFFQVNCQYSTMVLFLLQDELNAELEELEQEGLDESLLQVGGTAGLPEVPVADLPAVPGKGPYSSCVKCLICIHTSQDETFVYKSSQMRTNEIEWIVHFKSTFTTIKTIQRNTECCLQIVCAFLSRYSRAFHDHLPHA